VQGGKSLVKKIFFGALALGATVIAFGTPTGASASTQACLPQDLNPDCFDARQRGAAEVGPLAVVSTDAVTVSCQIYVNGIRQDKAHLDATVTGGGGAYVAAGAGPVEYHSFVTDITTMCTTAHYNGADHYWHAYALGDPRVGYWDETFNVDNCAKATVIDPNPEACPPLLTIDKATGNVGHLAETWQDCEPYGPII
jgi:hypothetical protein